MYTLKTLLDQRLRLILTICGVALCVMLMLFLLSVYRGVEQGSVEYVRASDADLWVLQRHTTNILRGSSLLTTSHGYVLRNTDGVNSASPVLFILAGIKMPKGSTTIYLTGFDPVATRGGPPEIIEGSNVSADDQIVLDGSFAAKYNIVVGDLLHINDDTLTVVGLSDGTNMFVIQYAFVTLQKAQTIAGFPSIVSCYQVKVEQGVDPNEVADQIRSELPGVAVYDRQTFLSNNIREMESGFLPLLYVVAVLGAIVLTAILSLILSVNVLERRQDFAVMKAIGAPNDFIPKLVIQQALILSGIGVIVALVFFFPLVILVEKLSPEVSAISSLNQIITVTIGVGMISLISSIIPNRKLRKIYPLEVFR